MKKYVNSGKFNAGLVLLWTLLGLIAGAIVGIAYTFIAFFNPIIYLNLLAIIGLALVLTWVVVFIVKRSKSRNRTINLTVTFLICLFSWYAGWAALMTYQFGIDFFWWLVHPGALFEAGIVYANNIEWTLNNSEISPGMLKVFYALEFIAFFIPLFLVAVKKLYYCEFCEGFMKPKDYYIPETSTVEEYMDGIKEGDLAFLDKVRLEDKMDTVVDAQYKINLHRCECCGERIFNFYHLRMKHKKGKAEIDRTTNVVENTYACRPIQE